MYEQANYTDCTVATSILQMLIDLRDALNNFFILRSKQALRASQKCSFKEINNIVVCALTYD